MRTRQELLKILGINANAIRVIKDLKSQELIRDFKCETRAMSNSCKYIYAFHSYLMFECDSVYFFLLIRGVYIHMYMYMLVCEMSVEAGVCLSLQEHYYYYYVNMSKVRKLR